MSGLRSIATNDQVQTPTHRRKTFIFSSGVNTGPCLSRVPGGASPTSRRPRACRCRARPPQWRVYPVPCASARWQAPSWPHRESAPRHRSCCSAPACWKRRKRRLQPAFRPRHSLPRGPERLSGSSRVRSAARSRESQPQEARAASCRTSKTVLCAWWLHARATNGEGDRPAARQAGLVGDLPAGAQLGAVGRAPRAHRAVVARRQERAVGGERHRRNAVRMAQPMRGAAGEHRGRPGGGVSAPAAQRTVDAAGGEHAVAPPDA